MSINDIVIIALIILSTISGLVSGFVKKSSKIVSLAGAGIFCFYLGGTISSLLTEKVDPIRNWLVENSWGSGLVLVLCYILTFLVAYIILRIIMKLIGGILNNTGLIRRRIRSPELCFHLTTMGTQNPIDIAVAYLEDKVDRQVLQQLLTRISQVQTQEFIMTDRAIEEVLLNQGYNPFPLVRYSERPDIVATHIQHGYIAIICDTSSSIVMLPTTLFEILEHVEEHRQTPLIGTFIRFIRMTAVFLSIYLVPIFALSSSFLQWDYSFFIQILIMELSIELLRIATVHTPQSLSNAMGLIAAILLGEFAIQLGFFSEDILMFCAIGTVGGFATPNYELSLTNKYIKIMMIISVMLLNIYGFILFNLIFWISLARIKTFGVSYLYPLYPFHGKELLRFFIRQPKKD